jgi:gamma-glutamylputrescine oxidase
MTVASPAADSHVDSWYLATAKGFRDRPALAGDLAVDACVIGGGYTGLSAALHLAERGLSVALLEAHRVGWGAAGRNGGQVGSGQRVDEAELERRFGAGRARELWDLAEEAKHRVRELVARHAIDCDLRPGQLITAAKPLHDRWMRERHEFLANRYGYGDVRYVGSDELRQMLGSSAFHGGLFDAGAFHLHPLNYALGLALACESAGVQIFERTPALGHDGAAPATIRAPGGTVGAGIVVLACDGYLGSLEPRIAAANMPINNFIVATAPLGAERARTVIRDDVCVHDTRFVVNYFRLSADHRLLFGGGENYRAGMPGDIAAFVRPYLLKIFPQLADVAIDYAWGGALGITRTRLPHVGRLGPNVYYAQGYSGHGISIGTLSGQLIAEAAAGTLGRFDVMAQLPAPKWPGGALLRPPLLALGMLWYALRDRL